MPDEKKPVVAPSAETLKKSPVSSHVRVFNKTGRTFVHQGFRAAPNTFATVPPELAEFWMDRYPDQVVGSETAAKELGGANARVAEIQGKLDEANKKIALLEAVPASDRSKKLVSDLQAKVDKLTADNAKLVEDNTELTSQLEKATAPAADARPGADAV